MQHLFWRAFTCLAVLAQQALAAEAVPVLRVGACPSGYTVSSAYCVPGRTAGYAIARTGACPSGYSVSGAYCLGGPQARHAAIKRGVCSTGYVVSGAYCLRKR